MSEDERQAAIAALQARRKARGMNEPLNRLRAYVETALANGETPVTEKKES